MPVLTADVTVKGARRDRVFQWLGRPENHRRFLEGAFATVSERDGRLELGVALRMGIHQFTYEVTGTDDTHGGRRVLARTSSRRVRGQLRYSLRTEKPSTDTMVTLHLDYDPGWIGVALDAVTLRAALDRSFQAALANLARIAAEEAGEAHSP